MIVTYTPLLAVPTLEDQFAFISSLENLSKDELKEKLKLLHSATIQLTEMINQVDRSRAELALSLISQNWGDVNLVQLA